MVTPSDILAACILIVDDREANVAVLKQMLREAGYSSVTSTSDPREVCGLYRQFRHDLILLDLQMPGMDGFQVMDELKEIETNGYLPVLVITAQPGHKLHALKAGARDFISKPFELAEVLLRVRNMLEVRLLHLETQRLYERIVAEQKVSAQLLLVFRSGPMAVSISTVTDGRMIDANEEHRRFFGYARDELRGRNVVDFDFWADPADRATATRQLLTAGPLRAFETQQRRRSGEVRDVMASLELIDWVGESEPVMISMFVDTTSRKQAEEVVRRLNADLEERVTVRTADLEAANQELEAFSYSVSHDLRAPLRVVDGFSQALLEDYAAELPAEGQRYLRTIREGARKLGVLIDDLLTFSRLSRQPLRKRRVDTGLLVRGVLEELQSQEPAREIDLRLSELPACTGDTALLRQVWINLLSNAFKYTRKREGAVVEIGCNAVPEGNVFFVRDNGTGFDMRYAGKLFGVFKRLHHAEDYEGSGVGLAIVKRVIQRHGGRIWAEAVVDRGATFSFTLEGDLNPQPTPRQ